MIETILSLGTLALVLIYNTWFWSKHTQKLADKLMSRNYGDYQHAQTLTEKKPSIKLENELPEDLRALQEIVPM